MTAVCFSAASNRRDGYVVMSDMTTFPFTVIPLHGA